VTCLDDSKKSIQKLYFYDTGLAAWLLGIQSADQLAIHPQRGALFETWVVGERFAKMLPQVV